MRKNQINNDTEFTDNQPFEQIHENYRGKRKKKKKHPWLGVVTKIFIFLLAVTLIGQSAFYVYQNKSYIQSLLFRDKSTPKVEQVTPKEEIKLTSFEKQTELAVKELTPFSGKEAEASAIAQDFTAKYLTMSNLKTQLDFLGSEYLYSDSTVEKNFREYALTNYYYYFPDLQKKYGQDGMPEIKSTKLVRTERITYTHSRAEKVPGYAYALANDLQKNESFMGKTFRGYQIQLSFTYVGDDKPSEWIKKAPNTMDIILLFDTSTSKWFISEFQTSLAKKNSDGTTTILRPEDVGKKN